MSERGRKHFPAAAGTSYTRAHVFAAARHVIANRATRGVFGDTGAGRPRTTPVFQPRSPAPTPPMIIRDTLVFRTLLAIARPRPDYDELRSHALLELLATAESVRTKVKVRLQEFALSELQFSTLVVLLALDPEPVLPTTLATHTSASRATMTDILDHMLARGYIERQRSKEDRRNYLITLTEAGRDLTDRAEAAVLKSFAELGSPLTEPAPRALLAICDKLAPRLHPSTAG